MENKDLIDRWSSILIASEKFNHLSKSLENPDFRDFVLLHTSALQDYLINSKKLVDDITGDYLLKVSELNEKELKELYSKDYDKYISSISECLKK